MQPPTSNAPFNAPANAEATSSAVETNSPFQLLVPQIICGQPSHHPAIRRIHGACVASMISLDGKSTTLPSPAAASRASIIAKRSQTAGSSAAIAAQHAGPTHERSSAAVRVRCSKQVLMSTTTCAAAPPAGGRCVSSPAIPLLMFTRILYGAQRRGGVLRAWPHTWAVGLLHRAVAVHIGLDPPCAAAELVAAVHLEFMTAFLSIRLIPL
jgi:hypothetical protein